MTLSHLGFLALVERHAKFEIATRWKTGSPGKLVARQSHEISGHSLMVERPAGPGVNISGDGFVTDFRGEFALEIRVPGDAVVCDCQCHVDTLSGKSPCMQALRHR